MTNRCDSVDALMYAYCDFMRIKEENQMLEKDKNCIEFSMRSMMATHKPYQEDTEITITGMAPGKSLLSANSPFDIPCDVVVVSRSYFEALQTENEQLKKKLQVPDPFADYKELLEKLYSKEDVEKLEWALNHICGGQASDNGWMITAKLWRRNYETLSKLVGFSSTEEIQDYLTNEVNCDTLQEAILKLIKENKYACEKLASANSSNNSWKAAAECNSPKELIEKREALEGKVKVLETEIEVYSRALKDWKEGTGCPSPSAAKTMIESQASCCHAYHEVKENNQKLADSIQKWKDMTKCETPEAAATWITSYESACGRGNRLAESVEKLKEEVVSWKNVTGYSTPEDYMHARISGAFHTPFDYTAAWQKATGCDSPCDAEKRIKALNERIDESEACYNHLLALTGFGSEGEIEDALDRCDHSTLLKALIDYEFDYEELLKLTGYTSNQDIRVALNYSEQFVYETMRELINSLKRKAKFTESGWKEVTGFETPEEAKDWVNKLGAENESLSNEVISWRNATGCKIPDEAKSAIRYYKARLGNAVQSASIAMKMLGNSVQSEASAMKILKAISYKDPIKED